MEISDGYGVLKMGVTSSNFTDSFLQSNVSLFNCNKILSIFLLTFHNILTVKPTSTKISQNLISKKEIYA